MINFQNLDFWQNKLRKNNDVTFSDNLSWTTDSFPEGLIFWLDCPLENKFCLIRTQKNFSEYFPTYFFITLIKSQIMGNRKILLKTPKTGKWQVYFYTFLLSNINIFSAMETKNYAKKNQQNCFEAQLKFNMKYFNLGKQKTYFWKVF